jgi:hypothetical protein
MESLHIYPWQIVAIVAAVAALIYFRRRERGQKTSFSLASLLSAATPKPTKPAAKPPETYMDLRRQALETDPRRLGLPGKLDPNVPYGVLMEMGMPSSVVTLACFADGDARLYYQSGGGMIGGIGHENVRKASRDLVARTRRLLPRMTRTTSHPLPGLDRVQFLALTPRGVFLVETSRETLGETKSELSALFYSGQEVVAQMREVQAQKDAPPSRETRPVPGGPAPSMPAGVE